MQLANIGCIPGRVEESMNEVREKLADYAHEAWSGWMKFMFAKGGYLATSGYWVMKPEKYERWQRQTTTAYVDLPEGEKTSDRDEADKIIGVLSARLPELKALANTLCQQAHGEITGGTVNWKRLHCSRTQVLIHDDKALSYRVEITGADVSAVALHNYIYEGLNAKYGEDIEVDLAW